MPHEPQFGEPGSGQPHRDRPAAFGVLEKDGKIAFVRITLKDGTPPFIDLPGGAIDDGETARDAVIREFGEEAGAATKIEDDHQLVWLPFAEALASLRHDAHAWGLAAWLRRF